MNRKDFESNLTKIESKYFSVIDSKLSNPAIPWEELDTINDSLRILVDLAKVDPGLNYSDISMNTSVEAQNEQ